MEMNRRQFCALGTAGALAAIAGGVSLGCSSEGASKDAPAAAAAMAIGDADVNFSQEVDVLIDGPFVLAERTLSLRFRGSKNQRAIDVPASLQSGRVVERDI